MFQMLRSLLSRTANLGGVAADFQNELAVTGTATPVSVNTGAALCYGIPYFNSAAVTVAIATPASSTRVDRIVLRASWAAKTVRITRIAGTEGAGTPAMTQTAGTTWDIPLATVSITTGGVITVTDAREWLIGTGDSTIDSTKLATNAVTTVKITDANVTNAKIADMAQSTLKGRAASAGTGVPTDLTKAQALTLLNVEDGADVTDAVNVGTSIHGATAKTSMVAADEIAIIDSAASNVLKRITYANLSAALGAELGTIVVPILNDSSTHAAAVTVIGSSNRGWLDVNQLPAAATVKLFLYVSANTSSSVVIDLGTETQAGSAAVISTVISVGAGTGSFLSADIKSSINTTHRVFNIQGSKASAGSVTLQSAQLVVEW